jgi:3-hydroxyacyl-CoA dehydrogenase
MQREIKKVAVLGSGVMGCNIAALCASCGCDVVLLDIVPFDSMLSDKEKAKKAKDKKVRNKLADEAVAKALKDKQFPFYSAKDARRVVTGNLEDDLGLLSDCDWIVEAVVERLDIKKDLWAKVAANRKPGAIVSTNTSGISVVAMTEGLPAEFCEHFVGAHFFNPPRWMKLLELIPHPQAKAENVEFLAAFATEKLGKGVIYAKDTTNFVANRVGVYGIMGTVKLMQELDYRIDEVDSILGQPMARPKTASFKTADLVGLDTLRHTAQNVYDNTTDAVDDRRGVFNTKGGTLLETLVEKNWLGNKTKGGFYKKGKDGARLVLDWKTMEYVPEEKMKADSIKAAKKIEEPGERIKAMIAADDRAGAFAWKVTAEGLTYAAARIPEITDTIYSVDRGLKWGFNQALGPFEAWDAIGVEASVARMKKEGYKVPKNVEAMLAGGNQTFYVEKPDGKYYFDFAAKGYKKIPVDPRVFDVHEWAKTGKNIVQRIGDNFLFDLGDGVILVSFHNEGQMNAIDDDLMKAVDTAIDLGEQGKFRAVVVGNNKLNLTPMEKVFCAGANVMMLLMGAQQGNWDMIDGAIKKLQTMNMRMRYGKVPVVTAPNGKALGGGCEIAMHGDRIVAAADLFMGLVEMGLGLIPAGGGCKEAVRRVTAGLLDGIVEDYLPFAKKALGMLTPPTNISNSGKNAYEIGYLAREDVIVASHDLQLWVAKKTAIGLAESYYNPGTQRTDIPMAGKDVNAAFQVFASSMKTGGHITEYETKILFKMADIVTGGDVLAGTLTSEWDLLDKEREAFKSLLGEEKTQERIRVFLMEKKMIRN